jgi:hypothetical protein
MMEQMTADSATIAAGDEFADQLGAMITAARDGGNNDDLDHR